MRLETPDPVIDEIRAIRHRISAECGHDPARLVEYYRKIQEQHADRLITSPRFAPQGAAQPVAPSDAVPSSDARPNVPASEP